jgi:hypothetical protein
MGRYNEAFAWRFLWMGVVTIFRVLVLPVILLLGIYYLGLIDFAWRFQEGLVMDHISDFVFFGGCGASTSEALIARIAQKWVDGDDKSLIGEGRRQMR